MLSDSLVCDWSAGAGLSAQKKGPSSRPLAPGGGGQFNYAGKYYIVSYVIPSSDLPPPLPQSPSAGSCVPWQTAQEHLAAVWVVGVGWLDWTP
jgi:hypothetical protein